MTARRTALVRLFGVHLAALTLLLAATANTPASGSHGTERAKAFPEVELQVRGVGLGASYARVWRQLGKPGLIKREKNIDDTCAPPHRVLTLVYNGLTLALIGSLDRDDFRVVSIEVTSAKWLVTPGIRIGTNEQAARLRLGVEVGKTEATGNRKLSYVNKGNDGYANFEFQRDRLVKVRWESALC